MAKEIKEKIYFKSSEAKKLLQVSDCHLAHLRLEGKLPFVKIRNAYMYDEDGLKIEFKNSKNNKGA